MNICLETSFPEKAYFTLASIKKKPFRFLSLDFFFAFGDQETFREKFLGTSKALTGGNGISAGDWLYLLHNSKRFKTTHYILRFPFSLPPLGRLGLCVKISHKPVGVDVPGDPFRMNIIAVSFYIEQTHNCVPLAFPCGEGGCDEGADG